MMEVESGTTTRRISFVAVSDADNVTRLTGLNSFTIYQARNGGAPAVMTAPAVVEASATNMPGEYTFLVNQDTTIGAGNDTEEMRYSISHAGMTRVTRTIMLYRPKVTTGNTLGVASNGDISGNVDGSVNSVTSPVTVTGTVAADVIQISGSSLAADNLELDYTATGYAKPNSTIGTCTTNTDMRGTDNALLASSAPANFSDLAITSSTGRVTVGTNVDKTGYFISGSKTTLDVLNDVSTAQVNNEVVQAIKTDTYPVPAGGTPPENLSLVDMSLWVYKSWLRPSQQSATEYRLYNAAGTTVEQKAAVAYDGTNTDKGGIVTGP